MGRIARKGSGGRESADDALFERVAKILDEARGKVARTVNTAMVHAYWLIGQQITLPEGNEQIMAARYLPTEEELRAELTREREEAERALRLSS